jgi:hypothetical protein
MITDNIATWVKEGILVGPFPSPPVSGFRANSIMAVAQKNKVRLVLDMSRPEGRSFNSNINPLRLGKVFMSTAKQFSYAVREAGKDALMNKDDTESAYKLIPVRQEDWRLQGIRWQGQYYIEPKLIFGSSASVPAYDSLSLTVSDLAITASQVPARCIFRTLDDEVSVAPAASTWAQDFSRVYKGICAELNIPLAPPCPNREKAFTLQTAGRVLGIWFDSSNLSWLYPEDKLVPVVHNTLAILEAGSCTLHQLQVIMGSVNDVAQMCPFLKGFRKPINDFLALLEMHEGQTIPIPAQVRADLLTCLRIMSTAGQGLPIAARPSAPPLNSILFTSDAAGATTTKIQGKQVINPVQAPRGAASVAFDQEGSLTFVSRIQWSSHLLTTATDSKGSAYGCKSTTLEMVGLLLPFLAIPDQLVGKHVILQVDNIATLFGWEKKQVKDDVSASILVRAMHMLEALLTCRIHIQHLPRLSSPAGVWADHLSRVGSTSAEEEQLASSREFPPCSPSLSAWLEDPSEDWGLAERIVQDIELIIF